MNGFAVCRLNAKLTQEEVADELHVSQAAVSAWECGVSHPTWNKLPKIAELFGCEIKDLFMDHQSRKKKRVLSMYRDELDFDGDGELNAQGS